GRRKRETRPPKVLARGKSRLHLLPRSPGVGATPDSVLRAVRLDRGVEAPAVLGVDQNGMTVVAAPSPAPARLVGFAIEVHEVQASRHALVQVHATHDHLEALLQGFPEGQAADPARLSANVL